MCGKDEETLEEVLDPSRPNDAVIDDNMRRFAGARAYGRSRHSTNGSKAASQRIASLCWRRRWRGQHRHHVQACA